MLNTKRTFIESITLQKVGSKQREELNFLAKAEVALTDKEDKALKSFFLSSVKSSIELNKFSHHVSLEYNTMYDLTKKCNKMTNNEYDWLIVNIPEQGYVYRFICEHGYVYRFFRLLALFLVFLLLVGGKIFFPKHLLREIF